MPKVTEYRYSVVKVGDDKKFKVHPITWPDYWKHRYSRSSRTSTIFLLERYVEQIEGKAVGYSFFKERPADVDNLIGKIFELSGFDEETSNFEKHMKNARLHASTMEGVYEMLVFFHLGEDMYMKLDDMTLAERLKLYTAVENTYGIDMVKRWKYARYDSRNYPLFFDRRQLEGNRLHIEELGLPDDPEELDKKKKKLIDKTHGKRKYNWNKDLLEEEQFFNGEDRNLMNQDIRNLKDGQDIDPQRGGTQNRMQIPPIYK